MDKFKKAIDQLNKPINEAAAAVSTANEETAELNKTEVNNTEQAADEKITTVKVNADASVTDENVDMEKLEKELEEEYVSANPESKAVLKQRKKQEAAERKKAEKLQKAEVKKQKAAKKLKKHEQTEQDIAEQAVNRARKSHIIGKLTTAIAVAAAVLIVFGSFANYNLNNQLRPVFYQIQSSKVVDNVRIVAISDMHLKEFGENNVRLVEKIASYHPDVIAIVGDMNIDDEPGYSPVINLCARLNEVAPLYYSLGNHEFEAMLFNDSQIYYDLQALGVKVLNNETETIDIGLSTIDVIGLTQGPAQFHEYAEKFFDEAMSADDNFKLVLTHYPENFKGVIEDYPIDLAISGHAHGGQIRLPYIGGLYSSDQGFLPQLCDGYHEIGNSKLVITKGLGRSGMMPRINNAPEITIIDVNWY